LQKESAPFPCASLRGLYASHVTFDGLLWNEKKNTL